MSNIWSSPTCSSEQDAVKKASIHVHGIEFPEWVRIREAGRPEGYRPIVPDIAVDDPPLELCQDVNKDACWFRHDQQDRFPVHIIVYKLQLLSYITCSPTKEQGTELIDNSLHNFYPPNSQVHLHEMKETYQFG